MALCAIATLASCSSQGISESPQVEQPPPIKSKRRSSTAADAAVSKDARDAGELDAETRISTREGERETAADGGNADGGNPEAEATEPTNTDGGAGEPEADEEEGERARDAGKPSTTREEKPNAPTPKKEDEQPKQMVDPECTRARLREKAEAYLQTMTSGDTAALRIHGSFRYTENGRDEQLGGGAWLRRGESQFSRHVLDETTCSTLTQAVMNGLTGRFSFGVRLRYSEGLLLEAEAQYVPELLASTNLDAVIPMGEDPFVAEVPQNQRMTRAELFEFAQRYFDSVTGISLLPPSAPECRRLQNGLPLGNGTCTEAPGTARFEQQRFDLADEPSGIVVASVLYNDHIGFYLIKMSNDMLQNIHVVGGASSQATGW